jgi:hypothetical protein
MVMASWNDRSVGDVHHLRRRAGKREIMRDKDQCRLAFTVDLQQQRHDLVFGLGVEIGGRLVRQQQNRIVDERPRDHGAALLACRHLRWIGVEMRSTSELRQEPRGPLIAFGGCAIAAEERGKRHIVDRPQRRQQARKLENITDALVAEARHGVIAKRPDVGAIDKE